MQKLSKSMETMKVTTYWVDADKFKPKGEYKETELDEYKRKVDFLITSVGKRYEIRFNHEVQLKESRSIQKSQYQPNVYHVTEKALKRLESIYSSTTDF